MVAAATSKAETAATKGGGGGGGGEQLKVRKGPWTEKEDVQLVWFVRLLGERRWDFLAKVSGLNRTGKSCRLRWVNYLHPGLKRGRMTPDEERLVVELHAKWGSRWSRIAKSMPGRTDNEIKNYWRTHMRKKAQQEKATGARSGSTTTSMSMSASPTSSSSSNVNQANEAVLHGNCEDDDEAATAASQELYTSMHMDLQLWIDIDPGSYVDSWSSGAAGMGTAAVSMPSPVWEYCSDSLWGIDDEEEYKKMIDAS